MKKGFTLIEVMICVAIVMILAAIAIPNFLAAKKAQDQTTSDKISISGNFLCIEQSGSEKMINIKSIDEISIYNEKLTKISYRKGDYVNEVLTNALLKDVKDILANYKPLAEKE